MSHELKTPLAIIQNNASYLQTVELTEEKRKECAGIIVDISVVIGAVINLALDAVFILGLNMGVAGAAWATVIGQAVSEGPI